MFHTTFQIKTNQEPYFKAAHTLIVSTRDDPTERNVIGDRGRDIKTNMFSSSVRDMVSGVSFILLNCRLV